MAKGGDINMEMKYGTRSVMPFSSKAQALKFIIKAKKTGYNATLNKKNGVYLVLAKLKKGGKK